jgi:hypothetical protein
LGLPVVPEVDEGGDLPRPIRLDRLRRGLAVERPDAERSQRAKHGNIGVVALRVLARSVGDFDRIKDAAGTAVLTDQIDLTSREARVHHQRPGIDFRDGEDQRYERQAVLADDHDPVARTNIVELEDERRICDDGRQLGVGPGDIAQDQGRVVRALARERLDDIADPVRQIGQDLLRFVSRRHLDHARLATSVAHKQWQ